MQQINLYLREFQPSREPLRAIHMAWGALIFLVLLVIWTVFDSHNIKQSEQKLAQEQLELQSLQAQTQALESQRPAQGSLELDGKIADLQKNILRHKKILSMISHQELGNDKGFSMQLKAMGDAALNTLSINSFSLQRGGRYVELAGVARSADQIPLYLQKLRASPSFKDVSFGVLRVERDSQQSGIVNFSLENPKAAATKNSASGVALP
jgi:Tfp pilus assembly protein PilN